MGQRMTALGVWVQKMESRKASFLGEHRAELNKRGLPKGEGL